MSSKRGSASSSALLGERVLRGRLVGKEAAALDVDERAAITMTSPATWMSSSSAPGEVFEKLLRDPLDGDIQSSTTSRPDKEEQEIERPSRRRA